jgi:hypothetical protein
MLGRTSCVTEKPWQRQVGEIQLRAKGTKRLPRENGDGTEGRQYKALLFVCAPLFVYICFDAPSCMWTCLSACMHPMIERM